MTLNRWILGYAMFRRYQNLHSFLSQIDMLEITKLLHSPGHHRHVIDLLKRLEKLDSVTKFRQRTSTTLLDARTLFDILLTDLPYTASCVSSNTIIIYFFHFETAICKLKFGRRKKLQTRSGVVFHCRLCRDLLFLTKKKDLTYAQIRIKKRKSWGTESLM